MAQFITNSFDAHFHEDGINFDLLCYIYYQSDKFGLLRTKTSSDGLSVPRAVENIIERYGKYLRAGILHDGAYRGMLEQSLDNGTTWSVWLPDEKTCNAIIDEALRSLGCSWIERETIYDALQLFGWSAFDADRHATPQATVVVAKE